MNDRVKHIDVAKGISIFLVAMAHVALVFEPLVSDRVVYFYRDFIGPISLFRLPLFFFLSGVFFSWTVAPKTFLTKKFEALLKPYFAVLLLLFATSIVLGSDDLWWQLGGIFYGNGGTIRWEAMWFLTHLFALYIVTYVLFRYFRFYRLSPGAMVAVLLVFMSVGVSCIQLFWHLEVQLFGRSLQLPGLPFSLDIILITSVYFICGHLLKHRLIQFSPNMLLLMLSTVLLVLVSAFSDAKMNLYERIYRDPLFATLGTACGIYIVVSFSWFISKSRWLSYVPLRMGEASLYILIFHGFIQLKFFYTFSAGVTNNNALLTIAVVAFGLSVSVPLLIKWVVVRSDILSLAFLPFESNRSLQRLLSSLR